MSPGMRRAGRWMSPRASRFSSRDRASRKWTSSTSPGTAARSSKATRGTKLWTQTLEEHLPGLPRDHQFRPVGLLGVAHRHQPGQVAGHFYTVAVLAAVAALPPLSAG